MNYQHIKDRMILLSVAAVALGIILIVLAETAHWYWLKVFGAGFITVGGVGLGVDVGLSAPRQWKIVERLKASRLPVALVVVAFLTLPVVLGLLAGLIGTVAGAGDSGLGGVLGGTLVVLLMTVATLVAIAMTVRSLLRAFRPAPVGSTAEDTLDQPREGEA
jgi:MFS family permease